LTVKLRSTRENIKVPWDHDPQRSIGTSRELILILSDQDIEKYLADGRIQITPPVRANDIRPAGIRLHLADSWIVTKYTGITGSPR
jgi:hypothetical protein